MFGAKTFARKIVKNQQGKHVQRNRNENKYMLRQTHASLPQLISSEALPFSNQSPGHWSARATNSVWWNLNREFQYLNCEPILYIINPACRFGTPVIAWATGRCWHGMHEVRGSNPCAHCSPDDATRPLPTLRVVCGAGCLIDLRTCSIRIKWVLTDRPW